MAMSSTHPSKFPGLLALVLGLLVTCGPSHAATDDPDRPLRRVVLISCDTLRSASLPSYGNAGPRATTGLDSLVNEGALFLRCTTPMGWTLPAHAAMFTGLAPGVVRVEAETVVPAHVPLLAERLSAAGFLCAGFPAQNHWLEAQFGFDRGMVQYRFQPVLAPIKEWTRGWTFADDLRAAPASASFFLFFHFMDTHTVAPDFDHRLPYWPIRPIDLLYHGVEEPLPDPVLTDAGGWDLPAYDPALLRNAYHASVHSLDDLHLRPLLRHLREQGLMENTLLIVTSDHGEEIAEHGGHEHDSPYGVVRDVPLLMVWPGVIPAGTIVFKPVSLLDLTPTVLDLAGLPAPEVVQGLSLRPLLDGSHGFFPDRDFLIDGHRRGLGLQPSALVGLEQDTWWSLIARTDTTGCAGGFSPARVDSVLGLYDLDRDPDEASDVQADHPGVVAVLRARLDEALADEARLAATLHAGKSVRRVEISDQQRQRLRALGY